MTENHTCKSAMDSTWEDELESHRYELTRVLRPDRYFEKFRSERVMDESDTQIINNETKNPTRDKKAGCFLDTVQSRGHQAYKLLLECLEADHPDLFRKMTGSDPEPKSWTMGLSRSCSCDCHDDRISLDLMEAYKKEKQHNISLKQEMTKLAKAVDTLRDEKLKLKHKNATMRKQVDVLQSETGDVLKLKSDIDWKRSQICDLQGKAYEAQTQLIAANDTLRKANLNNNALQNQLREAQAKLHLQRKKSTRLEQERSTDSVKTSDALRALVMQLTELGLERHKTTEVAQDICKPAVANNDLHDQTTLEILMSDKQEAVTKCEETVNELVDVRKKLYEVHEAKVKLEAENEELETNDTLLRVERKMLAERLQMAQEELTQVSAERSQAISERNRSFEETARSMFERDELVKKLNNERQSFLSQARQLFDCKSKVQKLKRDKKILLQDRPSSVVSTVSMDGSNDSKRSSDVPEGGYLDGTSSTTQDTTKSTTTKGGWSPSTHLEDKRSVSIGEIKQTSFDIDDDDDLLDYEYPLGRDRSQRVTDIPALKERRTSNASKTDIAAGLGSNRSSCRSDTNSNTNCNVPGVEPVDERDNGVLDSLPCDVDDRVATLWSEFDYAASSDASDKATDPESSGKQRRIMRPGMSTEVNIGSLKDKKNRGPGPRLSSYEIPASNYMKDVTIDRRSKTLGSDPDDPDPLKGVFDPMARKTVSSPDDREDTTL